jgi:hypothetical protein
MFLVGFYLADRPFLGCLNRGGRVYQMEEGERSLINHLIIRRALKMVFQRADF